MAFEIISTDFGFNFTPENLSWVRFMQYLPITGREYSIISIIGAQSRGKSTILNQMFGTEFGTRSSDQDNPQTTKGIHMQLKPNLVILDVEGLDSDSSGPQAEILENKMAAFALAVSNILIINLMANDIGSRIASCKALLESILNAQIELNKGQKKSIVFLIRDFSRRRNNLDSLKTRIIETIQNILEIPESEFLQFLQLKFFTLPTIDLEEEFERESKQLAVELSNRNLFQIFDACQPIQNLPDYFQEKWAEINFNEKLVVPLKVKVFSDHCCNEIKLRILHELKVSFSGLETDPKNVVVHNFNEKAESFIKKALEDYDRATSEYYSSSVKSIKPQLEEEAKNALEHAIEARTARHDQCCLKLRDAELIDLNERLQLLKMEDTQQGVKNFDKTVKNTIKRSLERFNSCASKYIKEPYETRRMQFIKLADDAYCSAIIERNSRSNFRCDQIKETVFKTLSNKLFQLVEADKDSLIVEFKEIADSYVEKAIAQYDESAKNYVSSYYETNKEKLNQMVAEKLRRILGERQERRIINAVKTAAIPVSLAVGGALAVPMLPAAGTVGTVSAATRVASIVIPAAIVAFQSTSK